MTTNKKRSITIVEMELAAGNLAQKAAESGEPGATKRSVFLARMITSAGPSGELVTRIEPVTRIENVPAEKLH